MTKLPNFAPAPDRRTRFPLPKLGGLEYYFCGPPACPTAAGEARR